MRAAVLATCASLLVPSMTGAGESCTEDAMIVFDGSGSMAEMGFNNIGEPRIYEARRAVREVIPDVAMLRRLGLVIYGPGGDRTCNNVDLRFGPQWEAGPRIVSEIEEMWPAGGTALTESVRQAAEALGYKQKPGAIVLVTDGKETCGGEPCRLAEQFAYEAPGLTVHVIGFKVRGKHFDWSDSGAYADAVTVARCLADETGGRYVHAETVNDLIGALRVTLGCNLMGQAPRRRVLKNRG